MAAKLTNELANIPEGCNIRRHSHEHGIYQFFIDVPKIDPVCPACGSIHCNIKTSGKEQILRHTPVNHNAAFLIFQRLRYVCMNCGITFYALRDWESLGVRMTHSLFFSIVMDLMSDKSVRQIALDNCVTESIVSTLLDNLPVPTPQRLSETICIDEFKGDSGNWNQSVKKYNREKFQTIIVDGDDHCVIDILINKTAETVKAWLRQFSAEQRRAVHYYCCDMHNGYVSVAKEMLPNANICIDMFHVIEKLHDAMDAIRCAEQDKFKEASDSEHYQLFHSLRHTLKTDRLNAEAKWGPRRERNEKRLDEAFALSPALKECYEMVQNFQSILHEPRYENRVIMFGAWISSYVESEYEDIAHAIRSLIRWKGYILNSWRYTKSNGPAEGQNNNVKVKKRIAYGCHNFVTLRKRILLKYGKIRLEREPAKVLWSALGSKPRGRNPRATGDS